MIKKNKKSVVFVSSGLGNAILLVPLLKKLKQNDNYVTILLNSDFVSKYFLEFNNFQFDEIIDLNEKSSLSLIIKKLFHFNYSYLDYSSSSVLNLLIARFISKKVIAMRKQKLFIPGYKFVHAKSNVHSAILNAKLVDLKYQDQKKLFDDLVLKPNEVKHSVFNKIKTNEKITVAIQISSANFSVTYKNWPTDYWLEFLKYVSNEYPNFEFILLGDKNEIKIGDQICEDNSKSIINMVGKTNLNEVCQIINNSSFYIGLDSGLMHLAVAYHKPTFTIWGGSSHLLFGYSQFDNVKHCDVFRAIDCRPCNAWIGANQTRVKKPINCPDIKCMVDLKPNLVNKKFDKFILENNLYK